MAKEKQTIQWLKKNRQYNGQRKTDNTMAKGKRTKSKTMIYKTLHRKLKTHPTKNHG
jgi:ribosomal protein S13